MGVSAELRREVREDGDVQDAPELRRGLLLEHAEGTERPAAQKQRFQADKPLQQVTVRIQGRVGVAPATGLLVY